MSTPTHTEPNAGDEHQNSFVDEKHEKNARESDGSLHATDGANAADQDEPHVYPSTWKLAMIIVTINLSTFIAALDLGIVATAIPAITKDFQSLNQIAWYSGAIFIMVGATSAMWGKIFTYFSAPTSYMTALILYMVGSVVAAAAPTSVALIVGRAIQGIGCAGALGGSVLLISFTAAPAKRPLLVGIWMGIFMTSTVLGPLLGGAFTSSIGWRWCFWINLPIGGAALVLQLLFLRVPAHVKPTAASWTQILLHLDLSGFVLLTASLISYTLALEWGGITTGWSEGTVVATLAVWLILTIGFVVNEWACQPYSLIPLRLLKPRMAWASSFYAFLLNCANFQVLFYLPIYFQSVKGQSAITSGVHTIPFVVFYAVGAVVSGGLVTKTRLLQPFELISPVITIIGAVLLYRMEVNTSMAWYIGAQIPFGLGVGLGTNIPVTALQAFAKTAETAITTGMIFTFQTVSGAYFNTAAQSVFEDQLTKTLAETAPQISRADVSAAGAGGLYQSFSGNDLTLVIEAYMVGIKSVFAFAVAGVAATALASLLIPTSKLPVAEEQNKAMGNEKTVNTKEVSPV